MVLLSGAYRSEDVRKAIDWYRKSADQGYAPAQANLAGIYIYGDTVPPEVKRGFRLAEAAANQNNNHGQFLVAYVYHHSNKDYRLAMQWYETAAKNNNPAAANQLGVLYFNGEGVEKEEEDFAAEVAAQMEAAKK